MANERSTLHLNGTQKDASKPSNPLRNDGNTAWHKNDRPYIPNTSMTHVATPTCKPAPVYKSSMLFRLLTRREQDPSGNRTYRGPRREGNTRRERRKGASASIEAKGPDKDPRESQGKEEEVVGTGRRLSAE